MLDLYDEFASLVAAKVDMSAAAVTVRLKRVSQLRRLCLALGKATPISERPQDSTARRDDPPAKK
jgi:hypothetical protein